ncbi:hypothetical protein KSP40_PGU019937 [Platanthera guangdongensis]|uniref:Uncharacterized protein n=1 Tax=Platanthera guangdongensis TaxID=2320717 RepID=A0ABR2MIL0_9ASPA
MARAKFRPHLPDIRTPTLIPLRFAIKARTSTATTTTFLRNYCTFHHYRPTVSPFLNMKVLSDSVESPHVRERLNSVVPVCDSGRPQSGDRRIIDFLPGFRRSFVSERYVEKLQTPETLQPLDAAAWAEVAPQRWRSQGDAPLGREMHRWEVTKTEKCRGRCAAGRSREETVYQSLQRNAQIKTGTSSSATLSGDSDDRLQRHGNSSQTLNAETRLSLDEAFARELQELENQLSYNSLNQTSGVGSVSSLLVLLQKLPSGVNSRRLKLIISPYMTLCYQFSDSNLAVISVLLYPHPLVSKSC